MPTTKPTTTKTTTTKTTTTTTTKKTTTTSKNKKLLFVGNGKTGAASTVNIPSRVKQIAAAHKKEIEVAYVTQFEKNLIYVVSNKGPEIQKEKYDYLILQEETDTYLNKYSTFLSGVKNAIALASKKNSSIKVYVRQVWLEKKSKDKDKRAAYKNATNVASSIGANIIKDGPAFDASMSKYSSINLFANSKDQSTAGAYLSALCIYKTIFKQSVSGTSYYGGLSKDNAQKLQKIADSTC